MTSKTTRTTIRMKAVRDFDYVTAGREYDVTTCTRQRKSVDFRRADGSGIGTYVAAWQFKRAIADGSIVEVSAPLMMEAA